MLTVLDEYTGEALSVTVATKMGSAEILDVLYPLLINRGKPEYLRWDNGPEFTSSTFKDWLLRVGIQPIQIYPGSPWENGLNESLFFGLDHARSTISEWRQVFNTARSHSSLGYQTPAAFAGTLAATGSDALREKGFAFPLVAQPGSYGLIQTAVALTATG